ncbi:trypsin-like [Penaeus japonicus]|uniref:trypsin-like n=1 Tax=Penaeus japonicus TaxID=27405 RepID=UPI001C7150B8|nr:trypsin-like [Penaeus japonicus]
MGCFTLLKVLAGALTLAVAGHPREHAGHIGRIVGGVEAKPGEFPFQVFLNIKKFGIQFLCGGALLDESRILTAAHCLDGVASPADILAVAGEHSIVEEEGTEQERAVVAMIPHEDYEGDSKLGADLAILQVASPFTLGDRVSVAPLAGAGYDPPAGSTCTILGWGTTTESGSVSPVLLKASLGVEARDICKEIITESRPSAVVDSSVICAGGNGLQDTCQGDSGGPLLCDGVVAGVVSWGLGCAHLGFPGIYTNVAHYLGWISQHRL